MKKYYITGVPGIGKTTVMHKLKALGYEAFDIDYTPGLCRWVNRETKEPVEFLPGASEEWHKAHAWECNIAKLETILNSLDTDEVFVFGVADNQKNYSNLFDQVFLMQADKTIFLERMAGRDQEHFGFNEDDRNSVLHWYEGFENDLIASGATVIDASRPIEATVETLLAATTTEGINE
jgi:hypothetical protein